MTGRAGNTATCNTAIRAGKQLCACSCTAGKLLVNPDAATMNRATILVWMVALLCFTAEAGSQLSPTTPAFPGAEGYGRFATGGRGGRVIYVTTLEDNVPGSLRAAVNVNATRTIEFKVSGTIKLASRLLIKYGNVTIAGQTAPGEGICTRDYTVDIDANNVIIRYLRFRLGDSTRYADDAIHSMGSVPSMKHNIILDHCSMSWSLDETGSFYDNNMVTIQWCYLTESLYHSYHPKGDHGYGGIWGGWKASFHHNLFAHHSSRNPRFNGSRYTLMPDSEIVDFRNNVIYNWGFNSAYGGEAGNQNMVANYFKYGPATNSGVRSRIVEPYDTAGNWYIAGNFVYGDTLTTNDNWYAKGVQGSYAPYQKSKRKFVPFGDTIETQTPQDAYDAVLRAGGASLPKRDTLDRRITNEVRTGTATYGGVYGASKGIIDSQDAVGGWPVLNSLPAPLDGDNDGIPDAWESAHGLNPADSTDGARFTVDGYSNLEHYLNSFDTATALGVRSSGARIPASLELRYNYPNPFNPQTTIEYALPVREHVVLDVYNVLGVRVSTLVESMQDAGEHRATFDGSLLGSGTYVYRLSAGGAVQTGTMVLVK